MTSIGFLSIGYLLKSKPPLNRLGCLPLAPGRPDVFCRPIPASQPRTPHAAPHSPRMVRGPSARAAVDVFNMPWWSIQTDSVIGNEL